MLAFALPLRVFSGIQDIFKNKMNPGLTDHYSNITSLHFSKSHRWRTGEAGALVLVDKKQKKPYNGSLWDFSSILLLNDDVVAIVSSTSCMIYVCSTKDAD